MTTVTFQDLWSLIKSGDLKSLEKAYKPELFESKEHGINLFHIACYENKDANIIKFLVKKNPNLDLINIADGTKTSTALYAVRNIQHNSKSIEALKWLLTNSWIDINVKDNLDNSALGESFELEKPDAALLILGIKGTVLVDTTHRGIPLINCLLSSKNVAKILPAFLKRSPYINVVGPDGDHPLIIAVKKGLTNEVKLLLALPNINVDAKDANGDTSLALSSPVIADLLIKAGATVDTQNKDGNSPLHLAVAKNEIHKVTSLIKAKAKKDITNNKGFTAKQIASSVNLTHLEKLL